VHDAGVCRLLSFALNPRDHWRQRPEDLESLKCGAVSPLLKLLNACSSIHECSAAQFDMVAVSWPGEPLAGHRVYITVAFIHVRVHL
jgi:hypothetical protein